MNTLRIPKVINFGKDALSEAEYPKNALVVTTAPPALSGKWLDRMGIEDYMLYDKVTPEPSIDDVNGVISEFKSKDPSVIIGLGGGSSMDVVKYSAPEMGKEKILIPTTFGTGAEMTTYCVLKFDGKKKLLREDKFLADRAVVDSYFMDGTPQQIVSNSVCDACAQATEGYDSKLGNDFTRAMCNQAFDVNVGGPMDMFFSNSISRGSCGVSASTTSRSWMTLIFFSSSACCSSVSVPPLSISLRYIVRDFARPESIVEVFASSLATFFVLVLSDNHNYHQKLVYNRI